jgi:hypothetical protein
VTFEEHLQNHRREDGSYDLAAPRLGLAGPLTGDTVPCPECREDVDNHHPCGEPGCGCWCMDPDTPAHMLRPPEVVGS